MQLKLFNIPIIGKSYMLNDQIFKCIRIRKSGINTFQAVDDKGKDLIIYDTKSANVILDHGIRLISMNNFIQ
jgi:hypothetical protein